ncbi:MAG: bacteriohemerythrin [Candidatus Paceibacterota bacterium]
MEKFIWEEKYSVGIKEIDEQHKHFFEIANGIIDLTAKENLAKEEAVKSLQELGDYAFYHLSTEESYFDKFKYQDAPLHINAHNEYREAVGEYFRKMADPLIDIKKLAEEMAAYSGNWLLAHIMVVDKLYTKFFNEHGLN